ncbi:MAG: hypothetical protein GY715_08215 [Planctomycetes bacterium]|nr:hypothetical protein [Planctomycetota bacterium]
MQRTSLAIIAAMGLIPAGGALAGAVCETEVVLDASGTPVLLFGGEIIGVGTLEGSVVTARLDVTFTATGSYDASALGVSFLLPTGGVGMTGAAEGWSGQGTFNASIETTAMNGDLYPPDGIAFYTWLVGVATNPEAGPITGSFDVLKLTLTMGPCPLGDLDGDFTVGFSDILVVIASWGTTGCGEPVGPCHADVDGSGDVGFGDILAIIGNWGDHWCPDCF